MAAPELNLVLGWYPPDLQVFGVELKGHDARFEVGEEWMEFSTAFGQGRESFDYRGKYFDIKGAYNQPRGVQSRPALLNAGRSARGREFAAKHCDIAFVSAHDPAPEAIKQVDECRSEASTKFKDIQIWMSAYVVLKDTTHEAQEYVHDYVVTQGDDAAIQNILNNSEIDTKKLSPEAASAELLA